MADEVRDVLKPLAKTAPGFKASMNGRWHKGKGEIRDPQNLNMQARRQQREAPARQYEDHDLRLRVRLKAN
jgi:predicted phage tail protein